MERLSLPASDAICGVSFLRQRSVRDTYPMHRHDFFEVFYVVKGRAMHHVNGVHACCAAGTVMLIRPEDGHAYSFINQWDMELVSIGISRELVAEVCAFIGLPEAALTSGAPLQRTLHGWEAAAMNSDLQHLEALQATHQRRIFCKAWLARLLLTLTGAREETAPGLGMPPWLITLLGAMSEPENFCAGLPRMLALSPVTQSHLGREMKRCLGMTPTEFINAKRIARAADLLLTGRYTSLEVAGLCGFETLSHFHENFRRVCGCAPREFAANHDRKEQLP